ncbi:MAG: hypothetical protein AB1478_12570 [Nitrospirota bacterium]
MKKSYFLLFTVYCLLFTVLFWGCGGSVSAPPDSTITINPETVTITDSGDEATHTQYFTILVKDSNGTPLGDIKITISFPWAKPDPTDLVQLYKCEDPKCETPEAVNSPFDAETDESGTYTLRFDYQSGWLEYKGDVEVRSGSAFGSATFEVTYE